MCVCVCVCVCVSVCWKDVPLIPEPACQTLIEQKGTNKQQCKGGDNRGIAPEQDLTDSILTSHPAASYILVLTIHVLYPINFFFLTRFKKKIKKATMIHHKRMHE